MAAGLRGDADAAGAGSLNPVGLSSKVCQHEGAQSFDGLPVAGRADEASTSFRPGKARGSATSGLKRPALYPDSEEGTTKVTKGTKIEEIVGLRADRKRSWLENPTNPSVS
jgi:hypothetical protein